MTLTVGHTDFSTKSSTKLLVIYCFVLFSCYSHQSISYYSWEVYIVHSGMVVVVNSLYPGGLVLASKMETSVIFCVLKQDTYITIHHNGTTC